MTVTDLQHDKWIVSSNDRVIGVELETGVRDMPFPSTSRDSGVPPGPVNGGASGNILAWTWGS